MVKLFVEEYHSRYARTASAESLTLTAYPLDKRYASFEDVYYLYSLSLANPQNTVFPPSRNVKDYERYFCFIVTVKNQTVDVKNTESISVNFFSLQWDDANTQTADRLIDDPIKRYPYLSESRPHSWLALFKRSEIEKEMDKDTPSILRLCVTINEVNVIPFEWNLPDECPFTDAKYESEIWTVAREKYAILPMPVHLQNGSKQ